MSRLADDVTELEAAVAADEAEDRELDAIIAELRADNDPELLVRLETSIQKLRGSTATSKAADNPDPTPPDGETPPA